MPLQTIESHLHQILMHSLGWESLSEILTLPLLGGTALPASAHMRGIHTEKEGILAWCGRGQMWPESRPHKCGCSLRPPNTFGDLLVLRSQLRLPGNLVRTGVSEGEREWQAEPRSVERRGRLKQQQAFQKQVPLGAVSILPGPLPGFSRASLPGNSEICPSSPLTASAPQPLGDASGRLRRRQNLFPDRSAFSEHLPLSPLLQRAGSKGPSHRCQVHTPPPRRARLSHSREGWGSNQNNVMNLRMSKGEDT